VPKGRGPTALQRAVREGLGAFLSEADELGGLPAWLVREFVAATTCGDVSRGFVLVKCLACGESLRVGFTCHGRTVCPPVQVPETLYGTLCTEAAIKSHSTR
jgi:hypothetical protein